MVLVVDEIDTALFFLYIPRAHGFGSLALLEESERRQALHEVLAVREITFVLGDKPSIFVSQKIYPLDVGTFVWFVVIKNRTTTIQVVLHEVTPL